MSAIATGVIFLAIGADLLWGEPPERIHPVVAFGRVVQALTRDWRRPALVGVAVAVALPVLYGGLAAATVLLGAAIHPLAATILAGAILTVNLSVRGLLDAGADLLETADRSPGDAEAAARALVGRETDDLGPGALRSAAIESLAENLADGLIGPLVAFALGSLVALPVGVGAAAWVKAINTLDSMLGYRDQPMGAASARLDDVVQWLPARATAGLLAVAAGAPGAVLTARRWAAEPRSPNSGWPMATIAAVLDRTLVKPGAYALHPGAGLPDAADGTRTLRVVRRAGLLGVALAGVIAWW